MNFDWTPQEQAVFDSINKLIDDATVAEFESVGADGTPKAVVAGVLAKLHAGGYFNLVAPACPGGWTTERYAAETALVGRSPSIALAAAHAALLYRYASGIRPADDFQGLIVSPALRDPDDGDGALCTSAVSDWGVKLSGKKNYCADGPDADYFLVSARSPAGMAYYLVKADESGVGIVEESNKTGPIGRNVCDVEFHDCPAVKLDLDGRALQRDLDFALALAAFGLMSRTFTGAKNAAQKRKIGGRALFRRQEVAYKLSEMLTLVQTADLTLRRAAWMLSQGVADGDLLVQCAKIFCGENATRVTADALDMVGIESLGTGGPFERAFNDARKLAMLGTSGDGGRNGIADAVLAGY